MTVAGRAVSDEQDTGAEQARLFRHRLDTALAAGLTTEEAVEFASSNADIGLLRYLADCEIDPELIARIVL